jgi:alkaline phosphatase D
MLRQLLIAALLLPFAISAQNNPNEPTRSGAIECLAPFFHGVASGDPQQDRVILWTRVTTDSTNAVVNWRIASDTAITNIINSGTVTTDDTKDFTVKVDATGLQPFTWYYYEFETEGKRSVRGRTRTLPVGDIDSLRFAIVSCADYTNGYYNAYAKITERNDIFAVIHLGDYIYEYGGGTAPRNHEPSNEILTLGDYRIRHSHYKLDEDLMRLHQQYPFFAVWDDHETANNAWFGGAENHTPGTEGDWFDRKAAGVHAYYEWMPLRMPDPAETMRIFRKFNIGDLIDLYMMDTRLQGRVLAYNGGTHAFTLAAQALGLSPRTLARRMQAQQLDFSTLVDQARRDAALQAVADTRQALADIGQSLGFAEPSTFWRAFKRWTGQTPAQWRLQQPSRGEV